MNDAGLDYILVMIVIFVIVVIIANEITKLKKKLTTHRKNIEQNMHDIRKAKLKGYLPSDDNDNKKCELDENVGMKFYSDYFNSWCVVVWYENDNRWGFVLEGEPYRVMDAQTNLQYFKSKENSNAKN